LELLSNTGDNRKFSITGWSNAEIIALDRAVASGLLPYCVRSQDFSVPGKKLAGRCYYFYISSEPGKEDGLVMAMDWLNKRVKKEI